MSIPVLVQVYDEVRRLAVAGSAVAPGDFRLKKLAEPLERAGAKAPVFARVAEAARAVVDSDEKTAAGALLELATLVNAILYTQGETGAAGELEPLETTDLGTPSTQASARVLKPLLEALSSTGSGRLELVRDAVEGGAFRDLRLVKPALDALDDPYVEVADLIAAGVVPAYGKAVVPELRARLDLTAKSGGHLHRLRLLHRLDPEGSRDLVRRALDEGSKEMRVVAVECLGTAGEDLDYLLEQTKSRAKDVRAAALRALCGAEASTGEVVEPLKKAIAGPDLELIVDRMRESAVPEIRAFVVSEAESQLDEVLAAEDVKKLGPAVARLQQLAACLEGRTDEAAEAFVLRAFGVRAALATIKSTPSGQDFNGLLAHVMSWGTAKTRDALVEAHAELGPESVLPAYTAARRTMTPPAFFKEFAPLLRDLPAKRGKKGAAAERAEILAATLGGRRYGDRVLYARYSLHPWSVYAMSSRNSEPDEPPQDLDPRWLDAAVDTGAVELVCGLARPGHEKANRFLSDQLKDKKSTDRDLVLQTMVRVGHPGAADAIIAELKKQAKAAASGHYFRYWASRLIPDLPRSALPKFEALLPELPVKMADQIVEAVAELRNKPEK